MSQQQKIWPQMKVQAKALAVDEPLLASFYHANILNHPDFASALAFYMASNLESQTVSSLTLNEVFSELLKVSPSVIEAALADIQAYYDRDPACDNFCRPLLFFKGYMAIQAYRLANQLWHSRRKSLARYVQHHVSMLCDVDIHPAATIGKGIMVDHGTGLVIGETARIGDNVSLLHGVTLGGTGNESGQRHPTVESGVMISSGVKVLGNITIGEGAKLGAGSVVLESVPSHVTVVGVPARIVGRPMEHSPSLSMDQSVDTDIGEDNDGN